MKLFLLLSLCLSSVLAHAQHRPLRDLRGRGGDQASLCNERFHKCIMIRYSVEGMAGKRTLLPQPVCAVVGRNLGGEDPLLVQPSACGANAIRTRFTRVPPPNLSQRLRPSGMGVAFHQFMNGGRLPANVCWEIDVNGGYDFAQLVTNHDICGPLAGNRNPARVNNGGRNATGDREDDSRQGPTQNRGINY